MQHYYCNTTLNSLQQLDPKQITLLLSIFAQDSNNQRAI
jgi:hypothetical protein